MRRPPRRASTLLAAITGCCSALVAAARAAAAMSLTTCAAAAAAATTATSPPPPPAAAGLSAPLRDARGRFNNPWPTWDGDKAFVDVLKFARQMRALKAPPWGRLEGNPSPTLDDMAAAFPLHRPPDFGLLERAPPGGVSAIWLGHAALLVRLGG